MGTFLVQSDQTCWIGSHGTYMTSELVQPVWVFTVVLCLARLCVSVCLRYWGDCPEFILSLRPNCGLIGSRICPFASLVENGPIGVSANCRALFGHLIVMVWDISDIYPYLQCNWDISFFFWCSNACAFVGVLFSSLTTPYCLWYIVNMLFYMTHSPPPKELRSVCFSPKLAFSLVSKCTEELATNVIVINRGRMRGWDWKRDRGKLKGKEKEGGLVIWSCESVNISMLFF